LKVSGRELTASKANAISGSLDPRRIDSLTPSEGARADDRREARQHRDSADVLASEREGERARDRDQDEQLWS
jgi:hypothetical protein